MEVDVCGLLSPAVASQLMRKIAKEGSIRFSQHALDQMKERSMTETDCRNLIRGGTVQEPELVKGSYRYRVTTQKMAVVVAFRSETSLVVVTAWRNE